MTGNVTITDTGFSVVELILVLSIIAVLASLALPHAAANREKSQAVACLSNRRNIEIAESTHYMSENQADLQIDEKWTCPSGGTYVWLVSDPEGFGYPKVGCSIHYAAIPQPLVDNRKGLNMIEGLVAAFGFEEGSGDTLRIGDDQGKIRGAQWVEGKFGSALQFDGKDDYAQVDIDDWEGPFTVMTWVKAAPKGQNQYDSIFASSAGGPKKNNFQIDTDGKGRFRFLGGKGNAKIEVGTITEDWTHLAVTFDGANVRTYQDGSLVDTGTWNGSGQFTDYAIGRNRNFNKKFGGTVDELGVFDRPVSAEEIKNYFDQTR